MRASVRDSRGSFMFPRYLQYLLTDFRQTVTGASWDTDDLITFLGQKVKVQSHTIAAEVHSTRYCRRLQLFLVVLLFYEFISAFSALSLLVECHTVNQTAEICGFLLVVYCLILK